ncbi:MAG TPA: DUF4062 domain-containing protein [Candidatus Acidoferrales bacterium]|nr:DUF4062 domain-containing protein [Candidatus Acidoferrales bacterium]
MKSLVFVSSAISEFREERRIAKIVIESYPFLEAWVFEQEGASGAPLEEGYLQKVRDCSILVVLLGQEITKPVRNEFLEAKANGKRVLVLIRKSESLSQDVSQFISQADAKYGSFQGSLDFESALRLALENELWRALSEPAERPVSKRKETTLRELLAGGKPVLVAPVFPQTQSRALYNIREVGPEEVLLQESSSEHQIHLPFDKIRVVAAVGGRPTTIQLDGRLQLLSAKRQWQYFPEHPIDGYGIPKPGSPDGPDVLEFRARLERIGISSQWNPAHEATSGRYSVVYDDDGRYYKCDGRMHRGSVEILAGNGQ